MKLNCEDKCMLGRKYNRSNILCCKLAATIQWFTRSVKNKRIIKKLDGNKKKDGNGLNRDERIIFLFF